MGLVAQCDFCMAIPLKGWADMSIEPVQVPFRGIICLTYLFIYFQKDRASLILMGVLSPFFSYSGLKIPPCRSIFVLRPNFAHFCFHHHNLSLNDQSKGWRSGKITL